MKRLLKTLKIQSILLLVIRISAATGFYLGVLPTAQALSQPLYILNPQKLSLPPDELNSLKPESEQKWITNLLRNLSLMQNLEPSQIEYERGLPLHELLKNASNLRLRLDNEGAERALEQAQDAIAKQGPYIQMNQDLKNLAMLLATGEPSKLELAKGFGDDTRFISTLPIKTKTELNLKPKNSSLDFKSSASRVFVNGVERKLPLKLHEGLYLVHEVQGTQLKASWIHILEDGRMETKALWSKPVWNFTSNTQISQIFWKSKPDHLPMVPSTLWIKKENAPAQALRFEPPGTKTPSYDPEKLFLAEADKKEVQPGIFSNPWFWVGSATILGLVGYFIYDQQTSKTLNAVTP